MSFQTNRKEQAQINHIHPVIQATRTMEEIVLPSDLFYPIDKIIQITYMHLDVKENNPYTQAFQKTTRLNRDIKIGIVGTTGNAHGMKPHLHISVKVDGVNRRSQSIPIYEIRFANRSCNKNVLNYENLFETTYLIYHLLCLRPGFYAQVIVRSKGRPQQDPYPASV